jgi:hypothetical protein
MVKSAKTKKNKNQKAPKVAKTKTLKKKPTPISVNDATQIELTDLANLLFGENIVKQLIKDKVVKNIRELWNISTNTTQCTNVIGNVQNNITPCWICGEVIKDIEGLTAECEHILPVAQAVVFLSLYSASKKKNYTEGERKLLSLEYGWAHTVCNQEKTDICCISHYGNNAIVLDSSIEFILKKIYNSNRVNSAGIKGILKGKYPSLKSFIDSRLGPMKAKYNAIVEYLNPTNGESRFKLTILAGLITAMDPSNIRNDAQAHLSPEFIKQKNTEKELFKNYMDDKIKSDIDEQMGLTDKLNKTILLNSVLSLDSDIKELFDKVTTQFPASWVDKEASGNWLIKTFVEDSRHMSIYYPLYNKVAVLSTKNKEYDINEAILNTKNCISSYLIIKYCEFALENIINNKRMTALTKENNIDKVSKLISKYKAVINKFDGIYEFIDEYYKANRTLEEVPVNLYEDDEVVDDVSDSTAVNALMDLGDYKKIDENNL